MDQNMKPESRTLLTNKATGSQGMSVLSAFREETKHPMELTTQLLMKLLDDNKDTEDGRKYGFS